MKFVKECGIESAKSLLEMGSGWCELNDCRFHSDELKRLVESWDRVMEYGSLEYAKQYLNENPPCSDSVVLEQAIADVEACQ